MKRNILVITLAMVFVLITFSSTSLAEDSRYLCIAEKAAGFSFNKTSKEWENTNFNANKKHILSKSSDNKGWKVKLVGYSSKLLEKNCEGGFNEVGFIDCEAFGEVFRMNNKSLRYINTQPHGYVVAEYEKNGVFAEGGVTPYMEIGKCSSF